jgi:hypothetical protein
MNPSRFPINIFDYGLGCLTLKLKAQIKTNKLIFIKFYLYRVACIYHRYFNEIMESRSNLNIESLSNKFTYYLENQVRDLEESCIKNP